MLKRSRGRPARHSSERGQSLVFFIVCFVPIVLAGMAYGFGLMVSREADLSMQRSASFAALAGADQVIQGSLTAGNPQITTTAAAATIASVFHDQADSNGLTGTATHLVTTSVPCQGGGCSGQVTGCHNGTWTVGGSTYRVPTCVVVAQTTIDPPFGVLFGNKTFTITVTQVASPTEYGQRVRS